MTADPPKRSAHTLNRADFQGVTLEEMLEAADQLRVVGCGQFAAIIFVSHSTVR